LNVDSFIVCGKETDKRNNKEKPTDKEEIRLEPRKKQIMKKFSAFDLCVIALFTSLTIVKLILVLALARQLAPVFRKFALKSQLSQY
jgi:hypothetical protein